MPIGANPIGADTYQQKGKEVSGSFSWAGCWPRVCYLVAPYLGLTITDVGIYKHPWNDLVSVEGLSIGEMGHRLSGIGRCIEPATFAEFFLRSLFELGRVSIEDRGFAFVLGPEVLALVLGKFRRRSTL